jgi:tetratricopeptide (TPR) repeat protein
VILVTLAVASYWTSLDNGFFYDDIPRIVENPGIRQLTPVSRFVTDPRLSAVEKRLANYRPILSLSLALDYARGELDPAIYHQTQLTTHAAATLGTWAGLGALLGPAAPGAAFWAAALIATHPVSGVPVRYVSGRDLLQMQFFLMSTLGLYLWRRRRGELTPATWATIVGLYSLSLLAKKNGVVLPALVLWIECVLPDDSGEPPGWQTGLRRALLLALPVVLVGLTARYFLGHDELPMVVDPTQPISPSYLATQAWVHWSDYLAGFLTPWTLHLEVAVPRLTLADPRALVGGAAILATLVGAWRLRRSHPEMATCVVAYWLLMVPTSSILNLYAASVPYRPYPSSAFLFGGLTLVLARFQRGAWVAAALVVASVAAAVGTDHLWQDARAVWSHSVAVGGSAKAYSSLAVQLEDPAERAKFLEESLRHRAPTARTGLALAEAWLRLGRREEALDLIRQVQEKAAPEAGLQEAMSRLLLAEGEVDMALEAARRAFELDPESIRVRFILARVLQLAGKAEESSPHLEFVAAASPDYEDVDLRRGYVAEARGDLDRAEELYRRFRSAQPDSALGARYLGSLLFRRGRFAEAAPELEAAHRGGQGSRKLDQELWACYRQLGKSSSAAEVLARLRRSPGR